MVTIDITLKKSILFLWEQDMITVYLSILKKIKGERMKRSYCIPLEDGFINYLKKDGRKRGDELVVVG